MLSVAMQQHLLKPYRQLAWMARFVRPSGAPLYVWSGSHPITYGGNTYLGYGYLSTIQPMKKTEGTEHIEQTFELNGIDPSIIANLDTSVRGLEANLWLGAVGTDRQIVTEPVEVSRLVQDTLGWSYALDDGSVTLRLVTYDALPLLGRATNGKFSYENQQERFANDQGFYYTSTIALQGAAVQWTQP